MLLFSARAGLRGVVLLLCLVGPAAIVAKADEMSDTLQIEQILAARCVKQGLLGQTPTEVQVNCGCLAKVGAKHLQPGWRKALLEKTSEEKLGPPMDDQTQFEMDARDTCPAIIPYEPKQAGQ
jgi:hypothetical protein